MTRNIIFTILFIIFIFSNCYEYYGRRPDKILQRDLQVITLKRGHYTTGRRVAPIPQLKCVGGEAQYSGYQPDVIQCRNMGWDGRSIQWKCEADMDEKYRLGHITVLCEGYDHPDDEYILVGSCGLEYTLEYTEKGKKQKNKAYRQFNQRHTNVRPQFEEPRSSNGLSFVVVLIIIGAIAFMLYSICNSPKRPTSTRTHTPPYNPEYTSSTTYVYDHPRTSDRYWEGMATGGTLGFATGYAMGNRRNTQTTSNIYPEPTDYNEYSRNDSDDDSSTRTTTAYGGTRKR